MSYVTTHRRMRLALGIDNYRLWLKELRRQRRDYELHKKFRMRNSVGFVLMTSFNWHESLKGQEFWHKVYTERKDLFKMLDSKFAEQVRNERY